MTDFIATLIVTLGLVPVLALCIIAFFSAITGTSILLRPKVRYKAYHAIVMFFILAITLLCVHFYFEALRYLLWRT